MTIYSIDGIVPVVDPASFVHPLACVIGNVFIGAGCYIGPFASLRGDFGRIIVESGSNVQDSCTVHSGTDTETVIGRNGHVGHGAILHGCRLMPNVLIGMNATVMDDAVIGEDSIVGAMAYVKASFQVPSRVLVTGIPGEIVRSLSAEDLARKTAGTRLYQELARRSLRSLREAEPLPVLNAVRERQRAGHPTKL